MEILIFMNTNTLNNFIEERFQDNYSLLLDNSDYIELSNDYNTQYRQLVKSISAEDLKLVENIIDIKSRLLSEEVYLAYKIGFADGFNLSNSIKN